MGTWSIHPQSSSTEREEGEVQTCESVNGSKGRRKIAQLRQDSSDQYCTADYVLQEFKEGFKGISCSCPKMATVRTILITLFLGILPSFLDFFSDILAGVSYLADKEYFWGGTKCSTLCCCYCWLNLITTSCKNSFLKIFLGYVYCIKFLPSY